MAGPLGWGIVEAGWRKGPWTAEEDKLLIEYVSTHGEGRWNSVARLAGNEIITRKYCTCPPKEDISLILNCVLAQPMTRVKLMRLCSSTYCVKRVNVEPKLLLNISCTLVETAYEI